jgi:glutamate racemase
VIGVYDSGIGGLSVLRALRAECPSQDLLYLADSGHGPYGERDQAHVMVRAERVTAYLIGRGIDALVVACNSATAAAIEELRAEHPKLPIIGVEPALKPAVSLSRTGRIGVLATRMTLGSPKFARLLQTFEGQAHFQLHACDGLALAIERSAQGQADAQQLLLACAREHVQALGPLGTATGHIDSVVLGCTHYPLIKSLLQDLVGPQVRLIETGPAVARHTRSRIEQNPAFNQSRAAETGRIELISTGDTDILEAAAQRWIDQALQAQHLHLP